MRTDERHQLKRDELITVLERGTLYVAENSRTVALVAGAIVVGVIAAVGVYRFVSGREAKASFLVSRVIQTYRAPVASSLEILQQTPGGVQTFGSAEERAARVLELADDMLSRHRSSNAAATALYYKALSLVALKRPGDAVSTLEEFLRRHPSDFLAPMARYELALVREAQGNPAEALVQFRVLAEEAGGLFPREEGLFGVARCQQALGNRAEALKTYQRIVTDFPESEYAVEARQRVQELS
jgi:TolA-binding protein